MKRRELKRKSGLKRGSRTTLKRSGTAMPAAERDSPERQAWLDEGFRQGVCAVTGRKSGYNGPGQEGQPYQVHHVLYEQEVERCHGAEYTLAHKYDTRNALRIANQVHRLHHDQARKIPIDRLRDENIAYAFELKGAGAYDWLKRRYAGPYQRLELALAEHEVVPDAA